MRKYFFILGIIASLSAYEKDNQIFELIEKGVDINAVDAAGRTALMNACLNGNKRLVELFIRKGADVNIQSYNGNAALMFAVRQKHVDLSILKLLVENGADVNLKNKEGYTALMQADILKDTQIAQYLRANGAIE